MNGRKYRIGLCRGLLRTLALALLSSLSPLAAAAAGPPNPLDKIAPWVLDRTVNGGNSTFIVVLAKQADTSGAAWLDTKEEKGKYVFDLLTRTAEATQGPIRELLDKQGVSYRAYWIVNMITVEQGDGSLALELASRDDVRYIESNPTVQNPLPTEEQREEEDRRLAETVRQLSAPPAPDAIAWGISNTNAPAVWTAGFSGAGIVIGGEDTGVYWQHGQLQSKYRGWNGATADHNYNWHDAVHTGGNSGNCTGPNMAAPCDDGGGGTTYHGTHTMGTMVGGDGPGVGTSDYGMAYGAKWIACRNMDRGAGTPTLYIECHQWMLAPTNLAGANPDPAKAPHVVNNSWGCPTSEGCPQGSSILLASIQALVNAGIVYEASNGNDGPGCGSVETGVNAGPPAIYAKPWVFSTGALGNPSTLANFSSLGPVTINGSRIKPDITAPGVSVLSAGCCTTTATATMSGTSMAGPHVCGAMALLLNARPALSGQVERILYALEQTTVHDVVNGGQPATCGTTGWTAYPSNFYGWGRLNIQAAVNSVCTAVQMATPAAPVLTPACTSVGLTWTAVSGATDYEVWRADASASCRPMYQVASTTGGLTTYNNTGLTASTQYSYYILAKNATCTSVAGACATTTTLASAPAAPAAPTYTNVGCTGLTVNWSAVSGAATYDVWRKSGACGAGAAKITASPVSGTSYPDTGLAASTQYSYYVVANNACGASANGSCSSVTTSACTLPGEVSPGATPPTAQSWAVDKTTMSWQAATGATGYRLYRGTPGNLPNLLTATTDSCTRYDGALLTFNLNGVNDQPAAGSFLWFLVTAYNGAGEGTAGNATAGPRTLNSTGVCP